MDMFDLGWRHAIFLLVGLAGIYLALLVIRLMKIGKSRPVTAVAEPGDASYGDARELVDLSRAFPHDAINASAQEASSPSAPSPPGIWSATAGFAAAGATAWAASRNRAAKEDRAANSAGVNNASNAGASADAAAFAAELARTHVEVDVQQLRQESSQLREELTRLREELAGLKAARNASPLYNEAMSLALNGASPDGIAGQCGISLAEAELVVALARGEAEQNPNPSGEKKHGGYPNPKSRTGTHG